METTGKKGFPHPIKPLLLVTFLARKVFCFAAVVTKCRCSVVACDASRKAAQNLIDLSDLALVIFMASPTSADLESSFQERVGSFRAELHRAKISDKTLPHTQGVRRLTAQHSAFSLGLIPLDEKTLEYALIEVAQTSRSSVVKALAPFVSPKGLLGATKALIRTGDFSDAEPVFSLLSSAQISMVLRDVLKEKNMLGVAWLRTVLTPEQCSGDLLRQAATHKAKELGMFLMKSLPDVVSALRTTTASGWKPEAFSSLDEWWSQAINAGEVQCPQLNRQSSPWIVRFPRVSVLARETTLDHSLPETVVSPARPRF